MTNQNQSVSETTNHAEAPLYCSFCRKDHKTVAKLVGGPGVYICDACVGLCNNILEGEPVPDFPGWSTMSEESLLSTLAPSAQLVDQARDTLQVHINMLRQRKVSWGKIGAALGISRQAAWERFG